MKSKLPICKPLFIEELVGKDARSVAIRLSENRKVIYICGFSHNEPTKKDLAWMEERTEAFNQLWSDLDELVAEGIDMEALCNARDAGALLAEDVEG